MTTDKEVARMLGRAQCLGYTLSGAQPRHPLMMAYDTPLRPWTL